MITGPEKSARQLVSSLPVAGVSGVKPHGYFLRQNRMRRRSRTSSRTCSFARWFAPNSPQWFNTGLNYALRHHWQNHRATITDPVTGGEIRQSKMPTHLSHTLVSFRVWKTIWSTKAALWTSGSVRARLFKYGSGTGTNFSKLRGTSNLFRVVATRPVL